MRSWKGDLSDKLLTLSSCRRGKTKYANFKSLHYSYGVAGVSESMSEGVSSMEFI